MPDIRSRILPLVCVMIFGAAGFLAGCTGQQTISRVKYYGSYSHRAVAHIVADGKMPLAMYGVPFDKDGQQTLRGNLSMPGWFAPADFVPAGDNEDAQIMLLFNPSRVASAIEICTVPGLAAELSAPGPDRRQGSGNLDIQAVLCQDGEYLSRAYASMPVPNGAGDPLFMGNMALLMSTLMPNQAPLQSSGVFSGGP